MALTAVLFGFLVYWFAVLIVALRSWALFMEPKLLYKSIKKQRNEYILGIVMILMFSIIEIDNKLKNE